MSIQKWVGCMIDHLWVICITVGLRGWSSIDFLYHLLVSQNSILLIVFGIVGFVLSMKYLSYRVTQPRTPVGPGSGSAIDSIPLCFEQLTSINTTTLQQLCAAFLQSQKPLQTPDLSEIRWHDIVVVDELNPVFNSTKIVLYKAHWRTNPEEKFSVMVSWWPVNYFFARLNNEAPLAHPW